MKRSCCCCCAAAELHSAQRLQQQSKINKIASLSLDQNTKQPRPKEDDDGEDDANQFAHKCCINQPIFNKPKPKRLIPTTTMLVSKLKWNKIVSLPKEAKSVANEIIQDGDYVLIYLDARRTYMIKMQAGQTFHTHKGYLKLDELIGKAYGEPIKSSMGIYFTTLKPILTDYIMKSSRNTQIIYPKDAALIVMFSGIGPGSRVVESGTGTGSLTTAFAHYVGPYRKSLHLRIAP